MPIFSRQMGTPRMPSRSSVWRKSSIRCLSLYELNVAFTLIGARQFDEVIAESRRILEREPGAALAHIAAALAHGEKGEFDEALQSMEKALKLDGGFTSKAMTAHVHAAKGDRRKAEVAGRAERNKQPTVRMRIRDCTHVREVGR